MTDSPRRDGPDPAGQPTHDYPGYTDPAYANPPLFGNHHQSPADANPTQQLPSYWQPGNYDPSQTDQFGQPRPVGAPPQPPEPNGPASRLWLWALAGLAVLLVVGMVTALVVVNSSQQQTVVAPPIEPSFTTTTSPRTTPRAPAPLPPPETSTAPSESSTPGASEEVVYDVSGSGRAINITYIDDGGILQTEFNVMLPWSKTVQLSEPANRSASVSIINVGREISCSITVGGSQISQKTGSGLTVCSALGGG